ncbi:alanine racemase [Desulfolithobacter sp.]
MIESLNRVEISRPALRHNMQLLRRMARQAGIMAMVKADGYGHGMLECAKVFAGAGAIAFGVAEVVEGVTLRQAGISQPVFVLAGLLPELVQPLFDFDLTPVLVDATLLPSLSREARRQGRGIGVHLKVDAGMGRQGCSLDQAPLVIRRIMDTPGVQLQGIMAHFPMADDRDSTSTMDVLAGFSALVESLGDQLPEELCLHIANSGGLLYFAGTRFDMVRPGISLYGCYPDGLAGRELAVGERLQPAMRFVTRVIQVKEVPAGSGLGYGHIYTTDRQTRLALLPVGYEDGYLRVLSNRAKVLVHGRRAPVIGRISMNLTMVDVTDLQEVRPGDEVVLLGRQGAEEISCDEIASWMGTINYEVLCLFGNLNRRVYLDD